MRGKYENGFLSLEFFFLNSCLQCNTSGESELQAASIKGDLRLVKKLIAMVCQSYTY